MPWRTRWEVADCEAELRSTVAKVHGPAQPECAQGIMAGLVGARTIDVASLNTTLACLVNKASQPYYQQYDSGLPLKRPVTTRPISGM